MIECSNVKPTAVRGLVEQKLLTRKSAGASFRCQTTQVIRGSFAGCPQVIAKQIARKFGYGAADPLACHIEGANASLGPAGAAVSIAGSGVSF